MKHQLMRNKFRRSCMTLTHQQTKIWLNLRQPRCVLTTFRSRIESPLQRPIPKARLVN